MDTADTSSASPSDATTLDDVNINAINVFEPMGYSPIPTDICLVGLDDDSVDEFATPEQSTVYDTDDPNRPTIRYENTQSPITDSYDWANDDIDDVRALVDTGAMVTCTGDKRIIHNYKPFTKLKRSPIRLKAALSSNQSVIPEGYGCIRIRSDDQYDCREVPVYYHPSITGTLLSPTSLAKASGEPKGSYAGENIYRWFSDDDMLTGNMTLITHHRRSKLKNIVVHGRLVGGQLYTHPLILPDMDPSEPHATFRNSFKLARSKDQSFIDLCKSVSDMHISAIRKRKHRPVSYTHLTLPTILLV